MRLSEDDEGPVCDFTGRCLPLACDQHLPIATCQYCGGERYRDYPRPGNWGQLTPGQRLPRLALKETGDAQ